ncbi:MAG: branched-chain amino acid ABC transporter permease [Reyranellaceae bacterium]
MAYLVSALAIAVAVAAALLVRDDYTVKLMLWIATNALLAACLRFVLLIGELNIATAAFYGIGAYVAGAATTMLQWPLALAMLAAALVAAAVAAAFGFITLRVKGPYFLLISFAFTEVVRLKYTQSNLIGGNSGMIGIFPPVAIEPYYPAIMIATIGLVLIGLYAIERSPLGMLFKAIKSNDQIVLSVGISVLVVKVICVVIAAAALGLGGALYAHSNNVISPGDFSFLLSVFVLAYVKIGGEDHMAGAILGAAFLTLLGQYLMGVGAHERIFFGAAIIVAMLVMPQGLTGLALRLGRRLGWATPAASLGQHK